MKLNIKPAVYITAASLTAILVLGNIFYLTRFVNEKKENRAKSVQISSLSIDKQELLKEVKSLSLEVQTSAAQKTEMQASISSANKKLNEQKVRIERLALENSSLKDLQREVKKLKELKSALEKQISDLESKLLAMQKENVRLQQENQVLRKDVAHLQEKNAVLTGKVDLASALKVVSIIVHPEKKLRHKYIQVRKGKKADRIAVSFELPENPLAEKGKRSFYLRITDPKKNLIKGSESGVFTSKEDHIIKDYTGMKEVNYTSIAQKVYFFVNTETTELQKGTYGLQIFCDGALAGTSAFEIK